MRQKTKRKTKPKKKNSRNTECPFIQDIDGTIISCAVVAEMKARMRAVFNQFEEDATKAKILPPISFTHITNTQQDYLHTAMYTDFPILRICDYYWKVHKLGVITYTQ